MFDPVIEAYKKDVDRTLLRENLKLTPEQRWRNFERAMHLIFEWQRSAGLLNFSDPPTPESANPEPPVMPQTRFREILSLLIQSELARVDAKTQAASATQHGQSAE